MADSSGQASPVCVSVIIPCLNEAERLGRVLDAVLRQDQRTRVEIVLADGGSSDRSVQIARSKGARVVRSPRGVSVQRNRGAHASRGDVLVFLDADCVVTPAWLRTGLARIQAGADLVGGPALASGQSSWVGRAWDAHMTARQCRLARNPKAVFRLLTTTNLFVRRQMFERVGGFDESLASGEDYFFCSEVDRLGGHVEFDDTLAVAHLGQPATARGFFRQQLWHCNREVWRRLATDGRGVGQAAYRYGLLMSVLALAAVAGTVLSCIVGRWSPALATLALFAAPAIALSVRTCAGVGSVHEFVPLTAVYTLYGLARAAYLAGLSRRAYGRSGPAIALTPLTPIRAGNARRRSEERDRENRQRRRAAA